MAYTICWLFEINRPFLSQFSPEHNERMFIFVFFPKSEETHKFDLFYRRVTILRDGFQTNYHQEGRQNNVTVRFVDHFDGGNQLRMQNNIKLQTLADYNINCTVYSGLQLLHKEKLREDFFHIPGLSICKPLEIRNRQVISTAKDVFLYSFVS